MKRFGWLGNDLRVFAETLLEEKMPRGRGTLKYRQQPKHLKKPAIDGKKHIVFISYYPNVNILKKSLVLRETGEFYTTLIACCIREDMEIDRWVDQTYEIAHYKELFGLLDRAAPVAAHVNIQPALLAAIAIDVFKHSRIVVDLYDSLLFLDKDSDSLPCSLERAVLDKADRIVHKMPPGGITEIREVWNIRTPDTLIHSLPWTDLFQDKDVGCHPPHRLVYAGGVIPYHIAVASGHENHVFDPIIEATAERTLELTIFANQNARNMNWEEHGRYFDFEKKFPHFTFRPGLPFFRLPQVLSDFHFGILYDNVPLSSYPRKAYTHNMSTKIFSYLEAGLPILVYEEMAYVAQIVEKHGVGLVYSLDDIHQLDKLFETADLGALRDNVRAYRAKNNLQAIADDIVGLYDG